MSNSGHFAGKRCPGWGDGFCVSDGWKQRSKLIYRQFKYPFTLKYKLHIIKTEDHALNATSTCDSQNLPINLGGKLGYQA